MFFFIFVSLRNIKFKEFLKSINDIISQDDTEKLTNLTVFEIPPEYNYSRLLLLSDFHLAQRIDPNQSIPLLFKQISKLNLFEKPSMILILGDSIDPSCSNQFETHYFLAQNIDKMNTTIFIIGGNHDRNIVQQICNNNSYNLEFKNIKYINYPIILLKANNKNYFFGHDLMHNFRIRGSKVPKYIHYLKQESIFSYLFSSNDSLIIGHTHAQFMNEENKEYCIGQFSIDALQFNYATIEYSLNDSFIQLKNWKYQT